MSPKKENWVAISVPGHDDLQDILVSVENDPEAVAEARSFVRSLAEHRQIAGRSGIPAADQATHVLEKDGEGKRRLVRKGFSAV